MECRQEDLGNGVAIDLVKIPAGQFQMGSPTTEESRYDREGPTAWGQCAWLLDGSIPSNPSPMAGSCSVDRWRRIWMPILHVSKGIIAPWNRFVGWRTRWSFVLGYRKRRGGSTVYPAKQSGSMPVVPGQQPLSFWGNNYD